MSSARPSLQSEFECCICKFTGNIQKIKTHLMVEHLEYFPWLCGKDGCGAVKFSQQKLEEHQLAHHGEECEMKYIPSREKHSELKRCLEAVKHGLKVNQAQPEASMANKIPATGPHSATSNLSSSTNSSYEQPVPQRSIINVKESESDDDCVIVHVQPYNPNEPKKPRRSSAESAIQNNHNSGVDCTRYRFQVRGKVEPSFSKFTHEYDGAMGKLCFGDENENVTVSPSKISPNVGDKRNPETNIEVAEPKRRRCQPRNEDNISIDPNSTKPTWLFCHVCNKDIRVYIYPPTGYMQNLLMHIEGHMPLIYSKDRYACSKCDFTSKYRVGIVRHNKSRHKLEAQINDRIMTWTLDEIRDVSFKCFKQRNLIENHMPVAWKMKNEKLMKDQNSTQMIDPNLPTTSRASMEQQDSEEMEDDRAPQVDMENDESDDSEEFYRI
ncbi:hypothetical protein WR25_14428 [Diploscapter pachys]|uniref:C2H2-type domain-containing protein n=1 Tax=Diploscapter pachys TaxID=2018661 RepID=A0A2A2JG37_9BILA|nr:hypothetical protein WR25_14428 [Diploscapter pachys]